MTDDTQELGAESKFYFRPKISVFVSTMLGLGVFMLGIASLIYASNEAGLIDRFFPNKALALRRAMHSITKKRPSEFYLTQLGNFRRDQFLVDRATGRIWQSVCEGKVLGADCEGTVIWEEMYVRDITPKDSLASIVYFRHLQESIVNSDETKPGEKGFTIREVEGPENRAAK